MVVSTHDLNLAASLCSSVVMLRSGRVIAAGETRSMLTKDNIRALYGVDADIVDHPRAGHPMVVPLARAD